MGPALAPQRCLGRLRQRRPALPLVTTYSPCFGAAQPDELFHNDGHGHFTDVSSLVAPDFGQFAGRMDGRGFQAAWVDYNGDGLQDLYVANDYLRMLGGSDSNRLRRNDGQGSNGKWHFTDVSASSHAGIAINSMGIGIGDYDRDGRLDLAVSNVGPNWLLHNRRRHVPEHDSGRVSQPRICIRVRWPSPGG